MFPLIYSLGYSFTDFRASVNEPVKFVGLANYRELLNDPRIWNNFWVTAKYVMVSVVGQMMIGFGLALLLNRKIPAKGLITTLLMLPMMMSAAVVGLVLAPAVRPVLGSTELRPWALAISPGFPMPILLSTPWRLPTSGCGRRS